MGNKNRTLKKFSLSFNNGSSNYRVSNFEYVFKFTMHLTAVEKEEQEQVAKLGSNYKQKKLLSQAMH